MRVTIGLLSATLLLTGCFHHKPAAQPTSAAPPTSAVIKPDIHLVGKIAMVNSEARFVVVSFPEGPVPAAQRPLTVYRNGAKVADLKVTGPQRGSDTVADITSGDAQVGDEVRTE